MAKDAKGHGSDGRGGGSTFDRLNSQRKAQGYKPMAENRRGIHDFLDYMGGDGPKPAAMIAADHGIQNTHLSGAPTVVKDDSVPGTTHKLVGSNGEVLGRLYKSGSPAWR